MSVSIKLLQLVFGNREQKMFVLQYLPRLCPETLNRVKKSEVAMMVLRAEPHDAITMAGVVMVSTLVTGSTLPPSGCHDDTCLPLSLLSAPPLAVREHN